MVEAQTYIWVINQARGQDGCISAIMMHVVFFVRVMFMERDGIQVHKLATKRMRPISSHNRPRLFNKDLLYVKRAVFSLFTYVNIPCVTRVHLYSI